MKGKLLLFSAGLMCGALAFFLIHHLVPELPATSPYDEVRQKSSYTFISPLLECSPENRGLNSRLSEFYRGIEDHVAQELQRGTATHISVNFRDLTNGSWFGIHENEKFAPASLLKVPVMIAYLQQEQAQPGLLEKTVKISTSESELRDPNITPSDRLVRGDEYTIRTLIERMITLSDNDAFETLLNTIDFEVIAKVHNDLGINLPDEVTPENYITIRKYSAFFRVLYNASYLSREQSEYALRLLSQATFTDALVTGVPPSVPVAHKYGIFEVNNNTEEQLHDCGIIYHPDTPYLLCVMTRGKDVQTLSEVIAGVSRKIYKGVNDISRTP